MPGSAGELYIRIKKDTDATTQEFHFPIVSSIEDTFSASLTTLPTIVYGVENNFCMDLGVTRRFSIKVERVSPVDYYNNSSVSDDWSNGEFYTRLRDALDFWQNFGYDGGSRKGGFTVQFVSGDEELYPSFSENVFFNGTMSPSFNVQKMTLTLPFVVATQNGEGGGGVPNVSIIMHTTDNKGTEYTETLSVPSGFRTTIPPYPSEWLTLRLGLGIAGWDTDPSADTVVYRAGNTITPTEDVDLYAVWRTPIAVFMWDKRGSEETFTAPPDSSFATLIAIGGGGWGGFCAWDIRDFDTGSQGFCVPGGAGGSGYMDIRQTDIFPGNTFTCTVGRGGFLDSNGNNHEPTSTRIMINGNLAAEAAHGSNGGNSSFIRSNYQLTVGEGGAHEYAGGMTITGTGPYSDAYGTDGKNDGSSGIPGTGSTEIGEVRFPSVRYTMLPGGGGGAAPLSDAYFEDTQGNRYPAEGTYTSRGGNGFNDPDSYSSDTCDGVYGGGGGAGCRTYRYVAGSPLYASTYAGGSGGDGFAVALIFSEG